MNAPRMSDARIRKEVRRVNYPVRITPHRYGSPPISGYAVELVGIVPTEILVSFPTHPKAVTWSRLEGFLRHG